MNQWETKLLKLLTERLELLLCNTTKLVLSRDHWLETVRNVTSFGYITNPFTNRAMRVVLSDGSIGLPSICKATLIYDSQFDEANDRSNRIERQQVRLRAKLHGPSSYRTSNKYRDQPVSRQRFLATPIPIFRYKYWGYNEVSKDSLPVTPPRTDNSSIIDNSSDSKKNSSENLDPSKTPHLRNMVYGDVAYLFKYIHNPIDYLDRLGQDLNILSIHPQIKKLRGFCNKKRSFSEGNHEELMAKGESGGHNVLNQINDSIIETKRLIYDKMAKMSLKDLAILLTAIKYESDDEFVDVRLEADLVLLLLTKSKIDFSMKELDLWLYVSDILYENNISPRFIKPLLHSIAHYPKLNLTDHQLTHLLFLVSQCRTDFGLLDLYASRIRKLLDNTSVAGLSVISLAYFKCRKLINDPIILSTMIKMTIKYLPEIDMMEPSLNSILKSIRYSKNFNCLDDVNELLRRLLRDADGRKIVASRYNLIQTIKLAETYRIYKKRLLNIAFNELENNLDVFRIKDIQYILSTLSNMAFNELVVDQKIKMVFDQIVQRITCANSYKLHHVCSHLSPLYRAFVIFGYYNKEFIEFSNNMTRERAWKSLIKSQLEYDKSNLLNYVATKLESEHKIEDFDMESLFKSSNIIFRDGITGNLKSLDQTRRQKFLADFDKNFLGHKTLVMAEELAQNPLLNELNYKFNMGFTFPSQNHPDLIISKDFEPPGSFDQESLMPKAVPENQRHCIVITVTIHDFVDGRLRLSGMKRLILRLAKKLGYKIVLTDLYLIDYPSLVKKIVSELEGK